RPRAAIARCPAPRESEHDAQPELGAVHGLRRVPVARHAAERGIGAEREMEHLVAEADGEVWDGLPVRAGAQPRARVVAAVDADVSRQTERPLPRDETAPVAADEWQPARPRRRTVE